MFFIMMPDFMGCCRPLSTHNSYVHEEVIPSRQKTWQAAAAAAVWCDEVDPTLQSEVIWFLDQILVNVWP